MWTGALSALPSNRTGLAEAARMTPEQTEAVIEAIAAALEDAELTTDELTEAIVTATGPWAGDLVLPAFQGMWARWRQAVAVVMAILKSLTLMVERKSHCFISLLSRALAAAWALGERAGFLAAELVAH